MTSAGTSASRQMRPPSPTPMTSRNLGVIPRDHAQRVMPSSSCSFSPRSTTVLVLTSSKRAASAASMPRSTCARSPPRVMRPKALGVEAVDGDVHPLQPRRPERRREGREAGRVGGQREVLDPERPHASHHLDDVAKEQGLAARDAHAPHALAHEPAEQHLPAVDREAVLRGDVPVLHRRAAVDAGHVAAVGDRDAHHARRRALHLHRRGAKAPGGLDHRQREGHRSAVSLRPRGGFGNPRARRGWWPRGGIRPT